jgi:hypothetical protein
MFSPEPLIQAITAAARDWSDPDYGRRAEAVAKTLRSQNTFTEEAVTFAVNQQMSLLTEEGLRSWLNGRIAPNRRTVGVLNAGNVPLVELSDFLAVTLTSHRYVGTISSKSPVLLKAFVADIAAREPSLDAAFVSAEELFDAADSILATGSDATMEWVTERCRAAGIGENACLLRGSGFAVAVLSGRESMDDYERLAEDVLLHEGYGCRNVAIIWAPRGLSPDPLLAAFAQFRGVIPAHASTPQRLKMQQAFLAAVNAPHAHGEGLEFLLSKGAPDVQPPGHIRWTEYDDAAEVEQWLELHSDKLQLVVVSSEIVARLTSPAVFCLPGHAQRPPINWCPGGTDAIQFLVSLP